MENETRAGSRWMKGILALVLVVGCGLQLSACGTDETSEAAGRAGRFRAELTLTAATAPGVSGVAFVITGPGGQEYAKTVPLQRGATNASKADLSDRIFADWLLVLPVGRHHVDATLVEPNGEPVAGCSVAQADVDIVAGMTTEVTLVSNCSAGSSGGLDTAVIVNHVPMITGLNSDSGKFVCLDRAFVAKLDATDADSDKLVWSFSVNSAPTGVGEFDYCLGHTGGQVVFSSTKAGQYEIQARVSDGRSSTTLTFPVYIDPCGTPACPGMVAGKALQAVSDAVADGIAGFCSCELPQITVSQNIKPAQPTVASLDPTQPPRPVARFVAASGKAVDFVATELLVQTDDPTALQDFLARWNGRVIGELDFNGFSVAGTVAPIGKFFRVEIDLGRADLTTMAQRWARANGVTGQNLFSDDRGMRLMAAALAETGTDPRIKVSIDPVMQSASIATRSTVEDPVGPGDYTPNAYQWPYIDRASEQDIGTGEAWTFMNSIGRLGSRVRIGIADGGFIVNRDFPPGTIVAGSERVPNPSACTGGTSCPWHGTWVALSAAAVPDNGIGVAGPAGPIADLTVLPSPAPDFFAYLEYIFHNIPTALATRPRIINISASLDMPAEVCLGALIGLPVCEVLNGIAQGFRSGGMLIFAAAGNDGKDVDKTKVFGLCPFCATEEETIVIPCELSGVDCVGGIGWRSNRKHPSSAFGTSAHQPGSVDIYGPFDVYTIEDPMAADDGSPMPDTHVVRKGGTSFASPYVAGVAALIFAANPSLDANAVERILLGTAHTNSDDPTVHRWVNALGAVMTAAGRDTPPFLRILTDDFTAPQGATVELRATVEELQGQAVSVAWRRAGMIIGTGTRLVVGTTGWALGPNVIEAQATDSVGNVSAIDTVTITLTPVVDPPITVVVNGASTGGLCPVGPDTGDAEFNGGPDIQLDVGLTISSDRTQLLAEVSFRATETNPGQNTEVRERFVRTLHTVAPGERILSINSPATFTQRFVGPGGGFHVEIFECVEGPVTDSSFDSGLVSQTLIIGDTPGGDISANGDCRCSTRINDIRFRPIELSVAR